MTCQKTYFTPLEIAMILHYSIYADKRYAEHDPAHSFSPAVKEAHRRLLEKGVLRYEQAIYRVTERARVYIEKLRTIPLPDATGWRYSDDG